ncbi:hypothetical protein T4B_12348 [Trichinella pseudospiralis]|uniref:Uncharacterized protein n=1 Tax=Trichinella pseudospiralis TaxID=6337 RepID=A0A0V1GT02_TRIPS|nr:hypothetical protein T4B_12348 [Trichinella pseudospiralis]
MAAMQSADCSWSHFERILHNYRYYTGILFRYRHTHLGISLLQKSTTVSWNLVPADAVVSLISMTIYGKVSRLLCLHLLYQASTKSFLNGRRFYTAALVIVEVGTKSSLAVSQLSAASYAFAQTKYTTTIGMQLKAMSLLEVTLYQLKLWRWQQCSPTTTVLPSTGGRSLPNFIYQEVFIQT